MITREAFLNAITDLINYNENMALYGDGTVTANDLLEYLAKLESAPTVKEKVLITENGLKILSWMKENEDAFEGDFTAAEIGKGMFSSGRAVSGSLRKLVTEGFIEKLSRSEGEKTTHYGLTSFGKEYTV